MKKAIEAKLAQAEAQIPQWEQRLAEARQAMAAASEQIVRWQAAAQVCSELLAGSTPSVGSTGSPTEGLTEGVASTSDVDAHCAIPAISTN